MRDVSRDFHPRVCGVCVWANVCFVADVVLSWLETKRWEAVKYFRCFCHVWQRLPHRTEIITFGSDAICRGWLEGWLVLLSTTGMMNVSWCVIRFLLFGVFPGVKFIECENTFEWCSDFARFVIQEVAHESGNFKEFFLIWLKDLIHDLFHVKTAT